MIVNSYIAGSYGVEYHLHALRQATTHSRIHYHHDILSGMLSAMRLYQTTTDGHKWVNKAYDELEAIMAEKREVPCKSP